MSDILIDGVKRETENDDSMKNLKCYIRDGWPNSKQSISNNISEYWNFRDELSGTG